MGNKIGKENTFPSKTHGHITTNQTIFSELEKIKPYLNVKDVISRYEEIRTQDDPIETNSNIIYNHTARTNVADTFWGRKNPINQSDICDYLKKWRTICKISTQKIDKLLGYKHTAGHWFRKDSSGSIPNPQDWIKLKEIMNFDDKYDKQVTELELKQISFEQSLRISNWDTPSDTITASGPEIHPNRQRRLSVRECAIIQTFPDNFVFTGSLGNMYKQIGNAVPVKMAEAIAKIIIKQL
jgi:DNA (cytosine-5)-methyltransferase 1